MPDILELAREHKAETGFWIDAQDKTWVQFYELADLEAFAQRIREDEREKAARVADASADAHEWIIRRKPANVAALSELQKIARIIAAAIRRGGDHG